MGASAKQLDLQRKIAVIVERYRKELPDRIAELRQQWQVLCEAEDPAQPLEQLFRAAHTLKGSAATLGFADVSAEAANIDAELRPLIHEGCMPPRESAARIESSLRMLHALTESGEAQAQPVSDGVAGQGRDSQADPVQRLLWVQTGAVCDASLLAQLGNFGFDPTVVRGDDDLLEALQSLRPAAVIIDIDSDQDQRAMEIGRGLQDWDGLVPPIVFLGSRTDIRSRLEAVRSGGEAYLLKPPSLPQLVEVLDRLTESERVEPYRILIVEDSGVLGAFYSVTLETAGMRTRVIDDPLQLLDAMSDFNPELVLMDMYLPGYTGAELAALIRQEASYVSVPIVYLSSETDLQKQLQAMSRGGDDFLTKPITPEHLTAAVQARADRYRAMGRLMVRDSLTGLLNHSRTKEQLAVEFKRAERQHSPLAFAMIDIDHFKSVNDTYGHPVGDRVIQSLARLLRQRLRTTDVVGRYGGEEFAVVLENANPEDALRIMDDLRERFAAVRHWANGTEFYVTISCGVACYPHYKDVGALSEAADRALYRAKNSGRNQVQVDCAQD